VGTSIVKEEPGAAPRLPKNDKRALPAIEAAAAPVAKAVKTEEGTNKRKACSHDVAIPEGWEPPAALPDEATHGACLFVPCVPQLIVGRCGKRAACAVPLSWRKVVH
jgi:hypothetical protein